MVTFNKNALYLFISDANPHIKVVRGDAILGELLIACRAWSSKLRVEDEFHDPIYAFKACMEDGCFGDIASAWEITNNFEPYDLDEVEGLERMC